MNDLKMKSKSRSVFGVTPTKNPYRECLRCPFKFFVTEEIFHSIIRSFERSTYRGSNKSDLLLTTQCNSCSTSNRQDDARRAAPAYDLSSANRCTHCSDAVQPSLVCHPLSVAVCQCPPPARFTMLWPHMQMPYLSIYIHGRISKPFGKR